jgi:IS30 family transposase
MADSTGRCNTLDAIAAEGVLQMKKRPRIYYSASQRALIWERWRKGETLHQIARLFDRYHSSIQRIVAESGGIRPTDRRRSRLALTLIEREEISRGVVAGKSIRVIAGTLAGRPLRSVARSDAMMAREAIEPVRLITRRGIEAVVPKVCKLAQNRALAHLVAHKLRLEWSPEQIAGWLKRAHPDDEAFQVSHETIYRSLFIQARGALKKELVEHLRRTRVMRRSRHHTQKTDKHGRITDTVSISERPATAEDRAVPGHWEGDLLFGSKNSQIVACGTSCRGRHGCATAGRHYRTQCRVRTM